MAEWGNPQKPSSPVDKQVYVDDKMCVWQYSEVGAYWSRMPNAKLERIESQILHTFTPWPDDGSLAKNLLFIGEPVKWNLVYSHSYVEAWRLLDGSEGSPPFSAQLLGRECWLSLRNLRLWLNTLPYRNIKLNVYIVVSSEINVNARMSNSLYGCMRGRHFYYKEHGKYGDRPNGLCGLSYDFFNGSTVKDWVGSNNLTTRLAAMFGVTMTEPEDNRALWFSRGRTTLYRMPKLGSTVSISSPRTAAMVINVVDGTYRPMPSGDFVVEKPFAIFFDNYGTTIEIDNVESVLRGGKILHDKKTVVLAFPLTLGNYLAFLLKPVGVDSMTFDAPFDYGDITSPGEWSMYVTSHFRNGKIKRTRVAPVDVPPPVQHNCFGGSFVSYRLYDLISDELNGNGNLDTIAAPDYFTFMLCHHKYAHIFYRLKGKLKVVRRKCCAPMLLEYEKE